MGSPDPLNLNQERRAAAKTGRGGKREGAGRPVGTTKKRSREIADGILSGNRKVANRVYEKLPDDATPLDVMIMAMREAYEVGGSLMAFPYAEKAAPYLHARITSITLQNPTVVQNADGTVTPTGVDQRKGFLVEFIDALPSAATGSDPGDVIEG